MHTDKWEDGQTFGRRYFTRRSAVFRTRLHVENSHEGWAWNHTSRWLDLYAFQLSNKWKLSSWNRVTSHISLILENRLHFHHRYSIRLYYNKQSWSKDWLLTLNTLCSVVYDAIVTTNIPNLNSQHYLTQTYEHQNKWSYKEKKIQVLSWGPCRHAYMFRTNCDIGQVRKVRISKIYVPNVGRNLAGRIFTNNNIKH